MPESNRGLGTPALIASTAILLMALGFLGDMLSRHWERVHETNAAYQKNAEYDRDKSADEIAEACGERGALEFRKCVRENLEAHYRDQAANEDLQAQQDMALWAFWLLLASIAGILVSFAGVLLLIATIRQGRDGLKVADAAVGVTREIGRDQVRAYVEISKVTFYWGTPRGKHPQFKIHIKNHGETPVKWFEVNQSYIVYPHDGRNPLPDTFEGFCLADDFGPRLSGVNPGAKGVQFAGPEITNIEEIRKCWRDAPTAKSRPTDNTHGAIIFGEVRYCTIFDEVYRSQFVFGSASIDAYVSEDPVVTDMVVENGVTYTHTDRVELPQRFFRFPVSVKLYEKEQ